MRGLRTAACSALVGLLVLAGCTPASDGTTEAPDGLPPTPIELEPDPPCVGATGRLADTSTEVVNAFALVDEDPVAAVDALEAAWDGFRERTADLDDGSRATVTAFDEALERLVDATRAAVADGQVDADALTAAAAEFEADARDAAALCEPEASPDA